jgi:hypothetical protein
MVQTLLPRSARPTDVRSAVATSVVRAEGARCCRPTGRRGLLHQTRLVRLSVVGSSHVARWRRCDPSVETHVIDTATLGSCAATQRLLDSRDRVAGFRSPSRMAGEGLQGLALAEPLADREGSQL